MYSENEKLILLQDVGKEDTDLFIPKNTEVTFIKAVDNKDDLSKALVVVKFENRLIPLPELAVKPKKNKTINALKDFNKQLMENRPELKVYHHNMFMRIYYRISGILFRLFINPFVIGYKKLTTPIPTENKRDKVAEELKRLLNEEK